MGGAGASAEHERERPSGPAAEGAADGGMAPFGETSSPPPANRVAAVTAGGESIINLMS